MRTYKRSTRVGELIQQEISKIVSEMEKPELGFVTISGVKLTDDLQEARIFYSVMGSEEEIERSRSIMQDSAKTLRHLLAVKLNLRRTPTLTFEYDDTPKKANRIFEILEKINKEEGPSNP